jgi:hypothetical protein
MDDPAKGLWSLNPAERQQTLFDIICNAAKAHNVAIRGTAIDAETREANHNG